MAIAHVQQSAVRAVFDSDTTFDLPGNFTAGNAAVIFYTTYGNITGWDCGGTTAAELDTVDLGDGTRQGVWVALNLAGGSPTVTLAGDGDGVFYCACRVHEFSGIVTSSAVDANPAVATGSGANPTSNATGTLDQADELALSILGRTFGGGGQTQPASWTLSFARDEWGSDSSGGGAYLITSATTSLTATWTASAQPWGVGIVTLLGAGGAPATTSDPIESGGRRHLRQNPVYRMSPGGIYAPA